jgi:hypothetical protein
VAIGLPDCLPTDDTRRPDARLQKPILALVSTRDGDAPLYYFYELHESDSDLFADVLLAHQTEYDEAEFLELVLESRKRVIDGYGQDSLIEAIAADLAARAGFVVIDDSQLRVAVNVSADEDATFVAEMDQMGRVGSSSGDFRTLLLDVEPDDAVWGVADGTRVKDDRLGDD